MIIYKLIPYLHEKGLKITDISNQLKISSRTMAKFRKNEPVSLEIINNICNYLGCQIQDIVMIEPDTGIFLKRLMNEREMKLKGSLYHEIQVLFSYNSNHIEGSRLSEDETRYIYETNTIDGLKNTDDVIEAANHFRCFDYMLDTVMQPLSESLIKKYHEILKSGTSDSRLDWFSVGDYKKKANVIGGHETCKPALVHEKMAGLVAEYNASENVTLESVAKFHFQFERIHPFQDGNGRVGRLLLFRECLKHNIKPFIIDEAHKMYYYRGLEEFNKEPGYLMGTFEAAQDKFDALIRKFES